MLENDLKRIAEYIGEGRHRKVYRHKQFVIKLPNEKARDWGENANWYEYQTFLKHRCKPDINGIEYARCRLMKNGWLVMEFLDVDVFDDRPKWADYIDCQQVGRNSKGRIVAYDYAP